MSDHLLLNFSKIGMSFWSNLFFSKLKKLSTARLLVSYNSVTVEYGDSSSNLMASLLIVDDDFFREIILKGLVGFEISYTLGYWHTQDLTVVLCVLLKNLKLIDNLDRGIARFGKILNKLQNLFKFYGKSKKKLHKIFQKSMLENFLSNSYINFGIRFPNYDACLDQACHYHLEKLCDQLQIRSEDHILEISESWGNFALYVALNKGCRVTLVVNSNNQFIHMRKIIMKLNLEKKIILQRKDYRQINGFFHKIVSIEFLEIVGESYYPAFFKKIDTLLAPEGKVLLQVKLMRSQRHMRCKEKMSIMQKYIFPDSSIPCMNLLSNIITNYTSLAIRSIDDISFDYAKTIQHWLSQYRMQKQQLFDKGMDDIEYRKWEFYLSYMQASFQEGHLFCQLLEVSRS